jgi:uncharacterized protein YkwD
MRISLNVFFITILTIISSSIFPVNSAVTTTSKLDTARKVNYLNKLEKDVVFELNKVRANPPQYAKVQVAKLKSYYRGKIIHFPGHAAGMITEEGVKAVDECYKVLLNTKPVGLLYSSAGLSKAAKELVKDQSGTGRTGHYSKGGSSPFDRMNHYGKWLYTAAENIDYGYNQADLIVLSILVDDGVPGRGHRKNIFNNSFKVIGVASGTHKVYRDMFVMDFAAGYKDK